MRVYNSQIQLPAAEAGMIILVSATSSTSRIYVESASSSAVGTDLIHQAGQTSTYRNIQLSGIVAFTISCPTNGQWHVSADQGSSVILVS